ncbi:hypothetical protein [Thiorhodovibrio winogradskyi]|nr:hypothetical protein [Thiorhodovibrio winogradskyi]
MSPLIGTTPVPLLDSDEPATRWIHPYFQIHVGLADEMSLAEIQQLPDSPFRPMATVRIRNASLKAAYWYRWSFSGGYNAGRALIKVKK